TVAEFLRRRKDSQAVPFSGGCSTTRTPARSFCSTTAAILSGSINDGCSSAFTCAYVTKPCFLPRAFRRCTLKAVSYDTAIAPSCGLTPPLCHEQRRLAVASRLERLVRCLTLDCSCCHELS